MKQNFHVKFQVFSVKVSQTRRQERRNLLCRKMAKTVKKTSKKKPWEKEAAETGDASNKIPAMEDGAEAAGSTDGDVQAGGSGV